MGFNEHQILGWFDKDEKGNIILLTNEKGDLVDKQGLKVNEKGYLWDRYGNIVTGIDKKNWIFGEPQLDDFGEIPLPFSFDRYNFNLHDLTGNVSNMSRPKNQKLHKDLNSWVINRKGWLCDEEGNLVSRQTGEIVFDKKQLTKDEEIPKLYNYDGTRFEIQSVMGNFERDDDGTVNLKKKKGA